MDWWMYFLVAFFFIIVAAGALAPMAEAFDEYVPPPAQADGEEDPR